MFLDKYPILIKLVVCAVWRKGVDFVAVRAKRCAEERDTIFYLLTYMYLLGVGKLLCC